MLAQQRLSLFTISLMLAHLRIISVKLSAHLQAGKDNVAGFKADTSAFFAARVKATICDQHFGLLRASTVSSS